MIIVSVFCFSFFSTFFSLSTNRRIIRRTVYGVCVFLIFFYGVIRNLRSRWLLLFSFFYVFFIIFAWSLIILREFIEYSYQFGNISDGLIFCSCLLSKVQSLIIIQFACWESWSFPIWSHSLCASASHRRWAAPWSWYRSKVSHLSFWWG
jgi:hypothetical protein